MTQMNPRPESPAPALQLVQPARSRTLPGPDPEIVRLKAQLGEMQRMADQLEKQLHDRLTQRAKLGESEILACLKQSRHMTADQILKALPGLAKSSLWLHLNALEKDGKVWFQVTHAGQGGRKVTRIWHGEEIAT